MNTSQLLRASLEAVADEPPATAFLAPLQNLDDEKTDEIVEGTLVHAQTELVAMESIDTLMDRHCVVIEGLEQIAQRLDLYGDEPMSSQSIDILKFSVESVSLGLEDQALTVADLNAKLQEGANTASEKSSAVREKAQQIIERVIAFMKSLWNRLVDIFHKLMGGASIVKHRVRRLEEALKQHNLRVDPQTNQLDVSHNERVQGIYEALRIGTTFPPSAVQTAKALGEAQASLNTVDEQMLDRYELDLNTLEIALRRLDASSFSRAMTQPLAMPKVFKRIGSDVQKGIRYEAGPIPGNWMFVVREQLYMVNGWPSLVISSIAEQANPTGEQEVAAIMVPVLSPQELTGLGPMVLKIATGIEEGRSLIDRLRKASGRLEPTMNHRAAMTAGGSIVIQAFQQRYREVGRMTMKVNMTMLKSALALVRWGEGSVAEYPKLG